VPTKLTVVTDPIEGKCNVVFKGKRCRAAAGAGTAHVGSGPCKNHMGNVPTVSMHHSTKLIEEAYAVKGGAPLEVSPDVALLQEVWRTAGRIAWVRQELINEPKRLEPVPTFHASGEPTGREELSAWVRWEQQERVALVLASKTAIAAGIAERQVKLAEQQGAMVAEAFRRLLDDAELGLTAKQRAAAPAVVRRALTGIADVA
jgi:hypothetical protein